MSKKKRIGVLIVAILVLIVANSILFIKQKANTTLGFSISGQAITRLEDSTFKLSNLIPQEMGISMIIFIAQWIIVLIIAYGAYVRYLRRKRRDTAMAKDTKKLKKKPSETDFDLLYNLLNDQEKVSIRTISLLFNISKDQALGWSKILQENELVTIEYPAFNDPEVIIIRPESERKKEEQETKKEKVKMQTTKKQEIKTKQLPTEKPMLKHRNIIILYLLIILTLGLYGIYWFVATKNEFNKQGAKVPTAWLLIIPIINIYWIYKYCQGFATVIQKDNKTMFWFILMILLSILMPGIIQSKLNKLGNPKPQKESTTMKKEQKKTTKHKVKSIKKRSKKKA